METPDWLSKNLDSSKLISRLYSSDSGQVRAQAAAESCRYEIMTVSEIVRRAGAGDLDVPAFQRGFVWTEAQLRDLAESLWRDYPIGMLLLWEPQIGEGDSAALLVADGQHRIISLCTLFGQKPHWCSSIGGRSMAEMSVWFDPAAEEPPRFFVGDRFQSSETMSRHLVLLPRLLALNIHKAEGERQLQELASVIADAGPRSASTANQVYRRLAQACAIGDRQVIAAIVRHPRDDVMEIFTRLSGHGIRFRRLLLRTALKATRSLWDPSCDK